MTINRKKKVIKWDTVFYMLLHKSRKLNFKPLFIYLFFINFQKLSHRSQNDNIVNTLEEKKIVGLALY